MYLRTWLRGKIPKRLKLPERIKKSDIELAEYGYTIAKHYFNVELFFTQSLIFGATLSPYIPEVAIITPTRYGKTFGIALASLVRAGIMDGEVQIGGGDKERAKIAMGKVIKSLTVSDNKIVANLIGVDKITNLATAMSKNSLKWHTGGSIEIFSVSERLKNTNVAGDKAIGIGGDLVILDESALISDKNYSVARRMLAESKTAKLVEISNPHQANHFKETMYDEQVYRIWINDKVAIQEGRLDEHKVARAKARMSKRSVMVFFDCKFPPKGSEDSFYSVEDLELMKTKQKITDSWFDVVGVDVARGGKDETVIIYAKKKVINEDKNRFAFRIMRVQRFKHKRTMETAGELVAQLKSRFKNPLDVPIGIDVTGVGGGVFDRLDELGYNVVEWISSSKPMKAKSYHNQKSEWIDILRQNTLDGRVEIPFDEVRDQIGEWIESRDSSGKLWIKDPADSPDLADATLIAFWVDNY